MKSGLWACAAAALGLAVPAVATPLDPLADADHARAVQCLAAAISYEAGNQSVEGQEAVAQVVLNRLRHPAFPKTICGVVFQGSARRTGCQFTFACDGSLNRPRSAQHMADATTLAERILAGLSSGKVGGATHYHADYVSPSWAPSLIKVATIGAHLFYRMPGAPDFAATVLPGLTRGEPVVDALNSGGGARAAVTTPQRPAASIFAPWGLPTATIAASASVRSVAGN
jgi:hypothetical protein